MVKSISITDKRVLAAMEESDNYSKLVETSVLYFLGCVDESYIEMYKAVQRGNQALKREMEDRA